MCPDELDNRGTCTNDVSDVSGFAFNREQCVSFTRSFTTGINYVTSIKDSSNNNEHYNGHFLGPPIFTVLCIP